MAQRPEYTAHPTAAHSTETVSITLLLMARTTGRGADQAGTATAGMAAGIMVGTAAGMAVGAGAAAAAAGDGVGASAGVGAGADGGILGGGDLAGDSGAHHIRGGATRRMRIPIRSIPITT